MAVQRASAMSRPRKFGSFYVDPDAAGRHVSVEESVYSAAPQADEELFGRRQPARRPFRGNRR